ncbi:MAG TPA: hypothetical protein VII84_06195 [Acidimicrobiales bacterium]
MNPKSPTRQQLEDSVRALLPRTSDIPERIRTAKSSTAGVGLGGLVTGYMWGWLRGRRSRRK